MSLSKRLRAQFNLVKCQKAKMGAKSHQAVEAAPLRKVSGIYVLPTEIIGGVEFIEATFTNVNLFRYVSYGRQMAREQANPIVESAPVQTRSKYNVSHPAGPGRTGRANSVPSFDKKIVKRAIRVVPVAKMSNAAKKEVIKVVKKNVAPISYVGSSWGAARVAEEVKNARAVVAQMPRYHSEMSRVLMSGRVRYAQAVLAIWGSFGCEVAA